VFFTNLLNRLVNGVAANRKPQYIVISQANQRHQDNGHTRRFQKESVIVEELIGKVVVIDVEALFVYVGKLVEVREKSLVLKQADVHDLRDSTTTREIYVRDARVHGIQANRKTVYVRTEQIVSVSHLDDVIP
jgi:hypothetical protein